MLDEKPTSRPTLEFDQIKRGSFKSVMVQVVILFGLWLIFSGKYDTTHIGFGVVAVTIVVLINYKLSKWNLFPERGEPNVPIRIFQLPVYILWLMKEIFIASIQVAYLVVHPKMPIKPTLILFRTKLPSAVAKVILGNSITITPGTFTIDIEKDKFLVHGLVPGSAGSLENGEMQSRIMKLFSKDIKEEVKDFKYLD
jgi:multicomponent Na+:H+ antiporter subunit E